MLPAMLALGAAALWGSGDFLGGQVARRVSTYVVSFWSAVAGTGSAAIVAIVMGVPAELPAALAWGSAAGLVVGAGGLVLYHGLATGKTAVVAPMSAVMAAAVPVGVGIALGEVPGARVWTGIVVALPAIWLLSTQGGVRGWGGVGSGILAGTGFGMFFVFFDRAPEGSGLWPLLAAKLTSAVFVYAVIRVRRMSAAVGRRELGASALVGFADGAASTMFLVSTRIGILSVAGVLASLYAAPTVALSAIVAKERIRPSHWLGVGLAITAVALISSG
jgi:uncharacterized membrane protein